MTGRETPPPVHVHVPEATPVHVHMKRSPAGGTRAPVKTCDGKDGGRGKVPWIPPGKTRPNVDSGYESQRSRSLRRSGPKDPGPKDPGPKVPGPKDPGPKDPGPKDPGPKDPGPKDPGPDSRSLAVLLKEEQETNRRRCRKSGGGALDTDEMLRALVEAEIDGVAVTNQLSALMEAVDALSTVNRLNKTHSTTLGRERDLLLEKIQMFTSTSHGLRALLRERSGGERESLQWAEQHDALRKRLRDCQAENIRLGGRISNKEQEVSELSHALELEKDSNVASAELSKRLDSTRLHLEAQVGRAQAENAQLSAHIQRLQQSRDQAQLEMRSLAAELRTVRHLRDGEERQRSEREAELVERVERAEEDMRKLSEKLHQKELQLAQALCSSSEWCVRHKNETSAKEHLEQQIQALTCRVAELNEQLRSSELQNLDHSHELRAQIQLTAEQNAALHAEKHRLQDELVALQDEARGLKSLLLKHHDQVDKHKRQLRETRLDAERSAQRLQEQEQHNLALHTRLRNLQDLPHKLHQTELRLKEAQRHLQASDQRSSESTTTLTQLRLQVEQQGAQLDSAQQRHALLQEENHSLHKEVQNSQRKLDELKIGAAAQAQNAALKEALVLKLQKELDERVAEVTVLTSRLQQSLEDARAHADHEQHALQSKERASQSRALDLQSELSRARTELSLLQRSKQEMERRFQGQLHNLKERLEHSDSTNRALQNYVHFLKTSYGNVFRESVTSS